VRAIALKEAMQSVSILPSAGAPASVDPLGTRLVISDRPGEHLEQLRFAPRLVSAGFEAALRERVALLAPFRHTCYARVRRVDRLDGGDVLALVSEHPRGARLSDVLAVAERDALALDINAALCVVRQLVPALAALHQTSPAATHGALSPDRILVTPQARIVITEHVVGSAIEQAGLSRGELWRDLHIMTPPSADVGVSLDRRADLVQIGAVSLALILGRPLRPEELDTLPELLASARETTVLGRTDLVAAPLRRWLLRALQLDRRGSFQSMADAQAGLDDVLSEDGGYVAAPLALQSFLARYQEHAARPARPAPATVRPGPVASTPVVRPTPVAVVSAAVSHVPLVEPLATPAGQHADAPTPVPPPQPAPRKGETPAVVAAAEPTVVQPGAQSSGDEDGISSRERAELKQFLEGMEATGTAPQEPPRSPVAAAPAPVAASEDAPEPFVMPSSFAVTAPRRRLTRERAALVLCAAIAIGEAVYIGTRRPAPLPIPAEGTVAIESRPAGATVVIDDRERGVTPLSLSLTPGPHVLALRTNTSSRAVPLTIKAGVMHAEYVELAPSGTTGAIDVLVDTPGARVLLDGEPRGVTPLTIAGVPAGDHDLVVEAPTGPVRQQVAVQAGLTTSVRPTPPAETAAPVVAQQGWVTIAVPFDMQVLEAGRQLGTTSTPRLPLSPGRHQLDIVSQPLEFRTSVTVDVVAGKATRVPVQLPNGSAAINATPWAEVWIDGEKAGETPIGTIALTLGPHELVFRHPDYPERRHAVSVTAGAVTRVSVEMKP
jgi:hypothetical protein